MNFQLVIDVAVLAGEIMQNSGAETYRVEDTINRILKASGVETADAFATTTAIVATLSGQKDERITTVRRITRRTTNLNRIYKVNELSRSLCEKKIDFAEAYESLNRIKEEKLQYSRKAVYFGMVVTGAAFTLLLGGTFSDVAVCFLVGLVYAAFHAFSLHIHANDFIRDMISSMLIALTAGVIEKISFVYINTDLVIIGAIMPLVPGVAITNAIRDTLSGDYMSGGSRAIEAFVKAVSIALGVGIGMLFLNGRLLGGVLK